MKGLPWGDLPRSAGARSRFGLLSVAVIAVSLPAPGVGTGSLPIGNHAVNVAYLANHFRRFAGPARPQGLAAPTDFQMVV